MHERIDIVSDEISQDLGEVRAFLDEQRLGGIEVRCVGGRRAPELAPADRSELEAWARAGDPRVLAVSPGLFKWPLAERERTRRALAETLPRALELTRALQAPFLIAFTFDGKDMGAAAPIRAAAEACREAGTTLLLENEPGQTGASASAMAALLEAVDHPAAAANWDPLNGNEFEETLLARGLERLFPRVRHVHVKNGRLAAGGLFARCGPLAEGAIDWPAHLRHLRRLGYQGWLGVETHHEPLRAASAAAVRELRAMLAALEWE